MTTERILGELTPSQARHTLKVTYCSRCMMPDTRPRIVFDDQGVCNACHNADRKDNIEWDRRREEFLKLVEPYRSRNAQWDCIVPWSGGKDSSCIAYKLKYEHGLNPLLVTFSPMLPTEIGQYNMEALIRQGFDHIHFRPDQKIHRQLAKRFFIERGNPKVAWDAGVNAIPINIAVTHQIPLVFYAEHGESEYGGKVLSEEHTKTRDFTEVIEHQIGDDPRNWAVDGIKLENLKPYIYPNLELVKATEVKAVYFAYFFKWSMFENYQYVNEKYDFKTHPGGRTCGTFTNFDSLDDKFDNLYYYMQFIKFGFGRCVRDTSRFIQNAHMT
ncbi:MAG: N-acetyl sugar amidotransferase, partial [Candidatus Omnitrophica bacterium]|nr:N-acetyl sugar amidotransferase [Candidatus Omnitrophota bacterium]